MIDELGLSYFKIRTKCDADILSRVGHAMDAIEKEILRRGVPQEDIMRISEDLAGGNHRETILRIREHYPNAVDYLHKLKSALWAADMDPRTAKGPAEGRFGDIAIDDFDKVQEYLGARVNVDDANIRRFMGAVKGTLRPGNVIEGENFRQTPSAVRAR
jgi:hypothetical protein